MCLWNVQESLSASWKIQNIQGEGFCKFGPMRKQISVMEDNLTWFVLKATNRNEDMFNRE